MQSSWEHSVSALSKYGIRNCRTSRQALESFDDHDSLENGLEQTLEAAIKYIQDVENVEMSWLFLHLDGHFRSEKYVACQQPSQQNSDLTELEEPVKKRG